MSQGNNGSAETKYILLKLCVYLTLENNVFVSNYNTGEYLLKIVGNIKGLRNYSRLSWYFS